MSAVETFEQLVRQERVKELAPFLLALPKNEVVAVRKKSKSLERELTAFKEITRDSWGSAITNDQRFMLLLAGLKTYSRKEAMGPNYQVWLPWLTPEDTEVYWEVLEHARPDWLTDKLEWLAANKDWATPSYRLIREMENRQLISHHPHLFASALPNLLFDFSRQLSTPHSVPESASDFIIKVLQADEVLLGRDLPLLFDFDTLVDNIQANVQLQRPNRPADEGFQNWQAWNKAHPIQQVSWQTIMVRLADSAHLSRADVLTRSLLALRRDFRRPLLTWFKNLFVALKPTVDERMERQQELVELLAHPLPLVVNFTLEQLKPLWVEPRFEPSSVLVYAEGLVARQDLKTGLRALLDGFEKLLKREHAVAPELGRLSAAALASADVGVQERAAKVLVTVLSANPSSATDAEKEGMAATAGLYTDLLTPTARLLLQPWLSEQLNTPSQDSVEKFTAYAVTPAFVPELSSSTAIAPVQDWHELLFLTGQVLRHDDPGARERWLEGLLRLKPQFPEGYEAQWLPYVSQMLPVIREHSAEEVVAILAGPITMYGYDGLAQALVLSGATRFTARRVETVAQKTEYQTSDPLMGVDQQRLTFVEYQLREAKPLPLLSTPTHAPCWIAPTTLVERLLVYEAAGQNPDAADLAIALARTAHLNQADAQAALTAATHLHHKEIRSLLVWFMSPVGNPFPNMAGGKEMMLNNLSEQLRQLLPSNGTKVAPNLAEVMPYLWAVAARTKQPDGIFEALLGLPAGDYPGIARPWQPGWSVEGKTGAQGFAHAWTELCLTVEPPESPVPSNLLLYSQHAGMTRAGRYQQWHHNMPLATDYPYLASMLPNNASALHWHVLHSAAWVDKLEAADRDIVHHALRGVLGPGAVFDQAASLVLATGLVHHTALCRAVAIEVLLSAINEGRLVPQQLGQALGQFVAAGYVPAQRLADSLNQVRAINAVTDDALRQLLDALLVVLPEALPRNSSKLLEAYAYLLTRNSRPIPEEVRAQLNAWKKLPALKKVLSAIQ